MGRQERPRLDEPSFDGVLYGEMGDSGQAPLGVRRWPLGLGVSHSPPQTCAILTKIRPNPTKERFVRDAKATFCSDLGAYGSKLHCLMWGIRNSDVRRPLAACGESEPPGSGGPRRPREWVLARIAYHFATGWVFTRSVKRGAVKTEPLLTTPLDAPFLTTHPL